LPPGYGGSDNNDDSQYFVPPQVIDINLDVAQDREPATRPLLIKNITAHELGHALGLLGHSPVKSDLLYKDTDEYSRLSERDLNTLNRLYQQKVDIPL
jgi:predicted Zn-dependent protease